MARITECSHPPSEAPATSQFRIGFLCGSVLNTPPDHESDQEDEEDEESSSEVNCKADRMEFIKEFQEIMNEAIDQLLKKPVRRHSHRKDKPVLHTEQGKCKEAIHKEAETLPPRNVSRESDDK